MFRAEVTVKPTHWHVQFCSFQFVVVMSHARYFDGWLNFLLSEKDTAFVNTQTFSIFLGVRRGNAGACRAMIRT